MILYLLKTHREPNAVRGNTFVKFQDKTPSRPRQSPQALAGKEERRSV